MKGNCSFLPALVRFGLRCFLLLHSQMAEKATLLVLPSVPATDIFSENTAPAAYHHLSPYIMFRGYIQGFSPAAVRYPAKCLAVCFYRPIGDPPAQVPASKTVASCCLISSQSNWNSRPMTSAAAASTQPQTHSNIYYYTALNRTNR